VAQVLLLKILDACFSLAHPNAARLYKPKKLVTLAGADDAGQPVN
jgi:hypothetical protein